jgi:hypothetical protein
VSIIAKRQSLFSFRRGERGCDGSHNRAARQALGMRGFQAGELAGNRQGKQNSDRPLRRSFPFYSLDGYYNLISSHHVKATARRRLDGARIRMEILNLHSQGLVCAA